MQMVEHVLTQSCWAGTYKSIVPFRVNCGGNCGCQGFLETTYIESNTAQYYEKDRNCWWTIEGSDTVSPGIAFFDDPFGVIFDVSNDRYYGSTDYVYIDSGNFAAVTPGTFVASLAGYNLQTKTFSTAMTYLRVRFVSDSDWGPQTHKGFKATYTGGERTLCVKCPPNTYSTKIDQVDQSTCMDVPINSQSAEGSALFSCNAGFSTSPSMLSCKPCVANTYKATISTDMCTACPNGTTSIEGSNDLSDCVCKAGYGVSLNDGVNGQCSLCPRNTYSSNTGTEPCLICPAGTGTASKSTQLIDCKCEKGYSGTADGVECIPCVVGQYKTNTGIGQCLTCPHGTSSAPGSDGLHNCKCEKGYSGTSDGYQCSACGTGTYKENTGTGGCSTCDAGISSRQLCSAM
jgi:hypothetical protein